MKNAKITFLPTNTDINAYTFPCLIPETEKEYKTGLEPFYDYSFSNYPIMVFLFPDFKIRFINTSILKTEIDILLCRFNQVDSSYLSIKSLILSSIISIDCFIELPKAMIKKYNLFSKRFIIE